MKNMRALTAPRNRASVTTMSETVRRLLWDREGDSPRSESGADLNTGPAIVRGHHLLRVGWRSATGEFDVLPLTPTVWAFLTSVRTTPAADVCCRIRAGRGLSRLNRVLYYRKNLYGFYELSNCPSISDYGKARTSEVELNRVEKINSKPKPGS
jgi:hypothetical protein